MIREQIRYQRTNADGSTRFVFRVDLPPKRVVQEIRAAFAPRQAATSGTQPNAPGFFAGRSFLVSFDLEMCGICGFITTRQISLATTIRDMAGRLRHRGPDDEGVWIDPSDGVALGHRRLAVVDLSPHGHQPMISRDGRYVITFNGEIYNHLSLRNELDSEMSGETGWRGRSDTEVLLEGLSKWGTEKALAKTSGMFAFALWDRVDRRLTLARDRIGEKPLYYGQTERGFVFASELKAFRAFPGIKLEIDPSSVALLLQYGYIPAPHSIYIDIRKLKPASWMEVGVDGGSAKLGTPRRYWALPSASSQAVDVIPSDRKVQVDCLDDLLSAAVREQMIADVPLGAFLSGGIDSTTVVSMMQAHASTPVRTFTIGFEEDSFNEAPHAKKIARFLGTSHTELYLSASDALNIIPSLPEIYDEPFADSSQIPTWLVAKMTREHVTVSLSGDGGDELFAGYPRYQFADTLWRSISQLHPTLRRSASSLLASRSPGEWDSILRLLPRKFRSAITGHRIHRLSQLMRTTSFPNFYSCLVSQWQEPWRLLREGGEEMQCIESFPIDSSASTLATMRLLDLDRYLPDDLLVKVDRATMNVSLEARAPFLNHRVVEFAFGLQDSILIHGGKGKWILKEVLRKYVPDSLTNRPKAGFSIPIAQWLRGALRPWADELLSADTLNRQGLLNTELVRGAWDEHLSGQHDRQAYLWNILMLQAWLQANEAR